MKAKATDNELLMQFAKRRDEAAFRQLVERYAPMVMSVGRLVVRHEQDAEDVFQVTFLVLAQRAGRLLAVTSLVGWLQKVAYRTAIRAAKRRSRRNETELIDGPAQTPDPFEEISARETCQLLHEELQKLKPRYRDAIVLCDLEGNSQAIAAQKLDCTEVAVQAALARARRQLRVRLLGRGVALSAAVVATTHALASVDVSLAQELFEITVAVCVATTLPGSTAIACSETVQILASKGTQTMMISAIVKPVPAVILAAVLTAAPLIVLAQLPTNSSGGPVVVTSGGTSETSAGDDFTETDATSGTQPE